MSLSLPPPNGLYDIHVHVGTSDTGELYYPDLPAAELLRLMDATGIWRANGFASVYFDPLDVMRDVEVQAVFEQMLRTAVAGGWAVETLSNVEKARSALLGLTQVATAWGRFR